MSPLHRFWFHARLVLIVAGGLPNRLLFPYLNSTAIPLLLTLCQMALILSLLWTLVQGYRRKRREALSVRVPLKW